MVNGNTGWNNLKPKQTVPFLLSSHGLGMWAMMDYFGEAYMGWPTMIKSRGHLDVAGFPRSTAWWYRTNYLANTNVTQYQRPLVGGGSAGVQVRALTPCQMFASTPFADIYTDGIARERVAVSPDFGLVDLRNGTAGGLHPHLLRFSVCLLPCSSLAPAACNRYWVSGC